MIHRSAYVVATALSVVCGAFSLPPFASAAGVSVRIEMSNQHFYSGEPFAVDVQLTNADTLLEARLLVALEYQDQFWFWPDWQAFSAADSGQTLTVPFGRRRVVIFPQMSWPDVDIAASGLRFYAALVDPGMTGVIGDYDVVEWSFGPRDGGVAINADARLKTGPIGAGAWLLPNGREIHPLGNLIEVDNLPLNLTVTPDGSHAIAACSGVGPNSLAVIDLQQETLTERYEMANLFLGLTAAGTGDRWYVSTGGDHSITVFDFHAGGLTPILSWTIDGFPAGLCLSADEQTLFIVVQGANALQAYDAGTGIFLGSVACGADPYTVIAHPDGQRVFVSAEGASKVQAFDVSDAGAMIETGSLDVPKNPEALALDSTGSRLFVACADEDRVVIIDTATFQIAQSIDLRLLLQFGATPNAVAFAPVGDRLYVASAGDDIISVIDLQSLTVIGAIPTAWYPTAVALTPDGSKLVIACGKGVGCGPSAPYNSLVNPGAITVIPIPTDEELRNYDQAARGYNTRPAQLFTVDSAQFDNPIPIDRGGPCPINHVVFVIRENKTYDALLGDWSKGDGLLANCLYCGDCTPNLHALADRFATGDNYYSNAEISIQGHELVTAAVCNSYTEKQWMLDNRPLPMELDAFWNPATFPKNDFIFQNAMNHGVSFRDYGEAVGVGKDWLILDDDYVHWGLQDPPVFWLYSRDVDKLQERIPEWEHGNFPSLIFMLFPDDHTLGCSWPFPEPRSMVADNDEATGRLVDWVSHSKYWAETAIFLIEDDPQDGKDHVDAHRSIMAVISPWTKRGYVSPVHYCEANIHATIERILGLPPMSSFDEIAQPMWDLFTSSPDFSPYQVIPRLIPESPCLPGSEAAQSSKGKNFIDPDEAEGLQDLLWRHEQERRAAEAQADLEKISARYPYNWRDIYEQIIYPAHKP